MIDEKILNILRDNREQYVSGEDLCRKLKISRTAVWKHIQKLKEIGYGIEAQPHLGYSLVIIPDKLLSCEVTYGLRTKVIGKKVYSYNCTSSTNDLAWEMAEQGVAQGTVILAEEQTKGRGRLGRDWASPRSQGIYMSIILRPELSLQEVSLITLMAAISVARALRNLTNVEALIKWPNDVMIDAKKVCGILTEMNTSMDKINFLILGIGLNVNSSKAQLPPQATSVSQALGRNFSRIELCRALIAELDKYYHLLVRGETDKIIALWKELSLTLGTQVRVIDAHHRAVEGQAQDIDKNGGLIIRTDSGFLESVFCGDVVQLR